jgi:dsDNA-specific endonuclease/ATPase MutS2
MVSVGELERFVVNLTGRERARVYKRASASVKIHDACARRFIKVKAIMQLREWLKRLAGERVRDEAAEAARAEEDEVDPFNPFPEPIRIEITDVFDLHTIAPRDVKRIVEEYLREAYEKGYRSVRIIHGKGIGVQRELVRSTLARTSFVRGWTDAPPEAGGWGATLVLFAHADE